MRHANKWENVTFIQKKKQATGTAFKRAQMIKPTIKDIFKDPKETMPKNLKEDYNVSLDREYQ